jgi:hypothetical protein
VRVKPEYLRLNEVAELLECEPHHVKDLVATGKLRCGLMAQGWWGHAMPAAEPKGQRWIGGVTDFSPNDKRDKTYHYEDEVSGETYRVRTAYVSQFWYLHHSDAYQLCAPGCDEIRNFVLEPAPGVGERLHQQDPERWPWPAFIFWPFNDQDPPPRVNWQGVLFLRRDVEALSELGDGDQAKDTTETAGGTCENGAAEFTEAVFQAIGALGLAPRALPAALPGRLGGWQARVRAYLKEEARKPNRSWLNPSADRMRHARAALLKAGRIVELPAAR